MPTRPSQRRRLLALLSAAAVIGAGFGASPALAGKRVVVNDAKKETRALRDNGRVDIVQASAERRRGLLIHQVKMRKRVDPKRGRERPGILINTVGGRRTNPEYLVYGPALFRIKKSGDTKRIGDVRLGSRGRTWTYRFAPKQIPKLRAYGWAAITDKGDARDIAPPGRYAKSPRR